MSNRQESWGVGSRGWGVRAFTPHSLLPTLFILSLLGYLLLLRLFPLIPRYNQTPLADVRVFTPSLGEGLGYGLLLLLLYGLYGLAYQTIQTGQSDRNDHAKAQRRKDKPFFFAPLRLCVKFFNNRHKSVSLPFILLTMAVFALPLLFTYPINANDVYRYFIRGRITAVYATSPYSQPPAAFTNDPYLPLAGEWDNATSPYGPIWELTAAALTRLAPDNLLMELLLFKLLGLGLHLATAVLIHHILKHQPANHRAAATLLWAWNPALLLFFVTDAHNDTLMLFWLTLGILLHPTPHAPRTTHHALLRHAAAFLPLLLAVLTKPIALLALPFFALASLRQLPTWRQRGVYVGLTAVFTLLLTWLTFLPFGSLLELGQRLLNEASDGGGFSPTVLVILVNRALGGTLSVATAGRVALFVFGLAAIWLLWRGLNGRSPLPATADIFLAYTLQALNFRIWYTTWPFPFLILDAAQHPTPTNRYRLRVGFWLLLTAQLSVLIHSHLRLDVLGGSHLWGHLIAIPFTFLLPFALARQPKAHAKPQRRKESTES